MTQRRSVVASAAARADVLAAHAYLAERSATAATRFLVDVEARFRSLAANALVSRWVGPARHAGSLRSTRVSARFHDYLIFYRVYTRRIRIVRVLHGARDINALLGLG